MGQFVYKNKIINFPSRAHGYIRGFWEEGVFYEQEMLEHIRVKARPGIFIDVGASTGNHSLYFSKFCAATKVLSFEPNSEHHGPFSEMMSLNNIDDVHLSPVALSDHSGKANVTYVINKAAGNRTSIDNCSTLDDILSADEKKSISVIKIDVEGHEMDVLSGSQSTLTLSDPILYIEIISQDEFESVETYLKRLNYAYTGRRFNATPTYEFIKRSESV